MHSPSSFRRLMLAPILFVALLACNEQTPGAGEPATLDTAPPRHPAATPDTMAVAAPDTGIYALPTPLPAAAPSMTSDTIPLHGPNGEPTRYGIETGRIVYRFTGDSRGERTITFDRWGLRERREENIAPAKPGAPGAMNNIILITTENEHSYADTRTKLGWRGKNEGFQRYVAAGAGKTISLGDMLMQQSGADRLPDTTISGYRCKVLRKNVKGMTVTNWLWRGIVIREHLMSPQDTVEYFMEPVEISPNIMVPESTFKFPDGYKITDYDPGKHGR